jgi:hypothetical protein
MQCEVMKIWSIQTNGGRAMEIGIFLNSVLGLLVMMAPGVAVWMLGLVIWGVIRHLRQLRFHSTSKRAGIPAQI